MSWPVEAKNIKKIQMEISNYCNARCPQCARELIFDGKIQPKHIGINDNFITLEQFKSWFDKDNWENLLLLDFCGNYDEPTTNPDLIDIVKWIMSYKGFNSYLKVNISTNGGTRNKEFWKELAEISSANISPGGTKRVQVNWGIDGLEDTNHIYRVNVKWDKLQENFRTFIKHGGRAIWQFIYFSHNEHQDEEARQRSIDEGFEGMKWRGTKGRGAVEKVKQASTPKFELENEKPVTKIQCKALSRPNYFGLDTCLAKATSMERSIRDCAPAINTPSLRCERRHSVIPAVKISSLPPFGAAPILSKSPSSGSPDQKALSNFAERRRARFKAMRLLIAMVQDQIDRPISNTITACTGSVARENRAQIEKSIAASM